MSRTVMRARDRSTEVTFARIAQLSTHEREVLEGLLGGDTNSRRLVCSSLIMLTGLVPLIITQGD